MLTNVKPVFWPQPETDHLGTEGSRVYARICCMFLILTHLIESLRVIL